MLLEIAPLIDFFPSLPCFPHAGRTSPEAYSYFITCLCILISASASGEPEKRHFLLHTHMRVHTHTQALFQNIY